MTNCVPCPIVGSFTQTSDVPFGSHVSISNGRPLPSMAMKARSAPSVCECRSEYANPAGDPAAMRTSTGNPESDAEPV